MAEGQAMAFYTRSMVLHTRDMFFMSQARSFLQLSFGSSCLTIGYQGCVINQPLWGWALKIMFPGTSPSGGRNGERQKEGQDDKGRHLGEKVRGLNSREIFCMLMRARYFAALCQEGKDSGTRT